MQGAEQKNGYDLRPLTLALMREECGGVPRMTPWERSWGHGGKEIWVYPRGNGGGMFLLEITDVSTLLPSLYSKRLKSRN